jgi:transcription initiation factor TFIIIB Brf1 subunit/transcription initiation factor TFIIB
MTDTFGFGGTAARERSSGPVVCAACGCRLREEASDVEARWFHFDPMSGRDARGCRVACVERAHTASGRSIAIAFA